MSHFVLKKNMTLDPQIKMVEEIFIQSFIEDPH